MTQSSPLSKRTWRKTLNTFVCVCVVLSNVLTVLTTPQTIQAAQDNRTSAVSEQNTEATPPPAYIVPSTIYLPLVANQVAPTPIPTTEPVVSLAKGCETPGITRGTELKQVDSTLATL